jgi:hypothetical protein
VREFVIDCIDRRNLFPFNGYENPIFPSQVLRNRSGAIVSDGGSLKSIVCTVCCYSRLASSTALMVFHTSLEG